MHWLAAPEDHDYPAAADYLTLLADPDTVAVLVALLRSAPVVPKKAKDILRAAQLPLLPPDNPHVRADLAKILTGRHLSGDPAGPGRYGNGNAHADRRRLHRVCGPAKSKK